MHGKNFHLIQANKVGLPACLQGPSWEGSTLLSPSVLLSLCPRVVPSSSTVPMLTLRSIQSCGDEVCWFSGLGHPSFCPSCVQVLGPVGEADPTPGPSWLPEFPPLGPCFGSLVPCSGLVTWGHEDRGSSMSL